MGGFIQSRQNETIRNRTYFGPEHLAPGPALVITSVWYERRGKKGNVSVLYKLLGEGIYRSPRELTVWFDNKESEFITKELENWKGRVNLETDFTDAFFPDFFLRERTAFLRWLCKTAKPITIEGYLFLLGRFVFPFFVQKMREMSPHRWKDSYPEWDQFISKAITTSAGRNRARTALRRYLKFLKAKGNMDSPVLPSNENERRVHREGEILPGELPDWKQLTDWLKSLPPGKARWIVTMCAAFGIRISEACVAMPEHLIGQGHLEEIQRVNDIIRKAVDTNLVSAFLTVNEAKKRQIKDINVLNTVGDADEDPKTGPYIACCSSIELANFIVHLIETKEYEGQASSHFVYRFIKGQANLDPAYPFSAYSPHDFRRLHITLQAFELQSFFIVAQLHGHSSEETTKRYYQWGLSRRQKKAGLTFSPISRCKMP